MLRFYRKPAWSEAKVAQVLREMFSRFSIRAAELATEYCFYAQTSAELTPEERSILRWLLKETFDPSGFSESSFLDGRFPNVLEVGPRLSFETAWSSTAVSICHACGLQKVIRLERSLRVGIADYLSSGQRDDFLAALYDRMTEMPYKRPLESFDSGLQPAPVRIIPLIEQGVDVLRAVNSELGLGMDEQDFLMYHDLFANVLRRDPTDVELFQLAQANSEHSRHHFFRGRLIVDGQAISQNLMDILQAAWQANPRNSLIAFCDDSSAIRGGEVDILAPIQPGEPCAFRLDRRPYHPTLTAETHNFPSGVAPFPGAETGAGGRIRDNQAVGRGGLVIAGGAAYCVGNLRIPGYELPWEMDGWSHPANLASPLDILVQASNGASDYGNKFGEPVVCGFIRSFGLALPDGYRGWFKPIMYTVGAGQIDGRHTSKGEPRDGMLILQLGGPAYRIGLGGGAASSMIQGENAAELDFDAVQRGDAQMEQRMNRLIRACVELGEDNPIVSIHDLGAGGDCNALPELVHPAGARIELRALPCGDQSLSVLEIWGNEAQERSALLVWPKSLEHIQEICKREGVPCAVVGQVTGDGRVVLYDQSDGATPVDLPLGKVLGDLPPKTFELERTPFKRLPLELPDDLSVAAALNLVLRLPAVGSKRFLTTKVDRSVTGLIAQQQCVGPNQLTLADFAVIAQSHFGLKGVALSLGEQPLKGLLSPQAMARLAVAEALLNLAGAKITRLEDIKYSGNWMLAAKLPGEGAWLYDAACALRDISLELGIAEDGGKDSLSMAAKTVSPDGSQQTVKAPGQLVVAFYATMDDVTCKVTPDLKKAGSVLLFIDLGGGQRRLGGSALAQVCSQVGDDCPDVEDVDLLKRVFEAVQELVENKLILALHDRSDGGLITTVLEMAFAGNVGLYLEISSEGNPLEALFNEELGLVLECALPERVERFLRERDIPVQQIGSSHSGEDITLWHNDRIVLDDKMTVLRDVWEATSSAIDSLQANPQCVLRERAVNQRWREDPRYALSFDPKLTAPEALEAGRKPRVAIIREQGSNGDREMAAAFFMAGFEPWDVTMTDLLEGRISLDDFRGAAFVGGFSFADVMDAGKGWAGVVRFNSAAREQFRRFYERSDTFSFGVCNGCQLMALLGWVPQYNLPDEQRPRFIRNSSDRFESRFSSVLIASSPAIMLRDMEGSNLGVWVAHAEGRLHIPDDNVKCYILDNGLAPLRYTDYTGKITEEYPLNPNSSPLGIAALCSPDGRHLAMMPHPERTFLTWQWPWMPEDWRELKASPWLRLFQNAYKWCVDNK